MLDLKNPSLTDWPGSKDPCDGPQAEPRSSRRTLFFFFLLLAQIRDSGRLLSSNSTAPVFVDIVCIYFRIIYDEETSRGLSKIKAEKKNHVEMACSGSGWSGESGGAGCFRQVLASELIILITGNHQSSIRMNLSRRSCFFCQVQRGANRPVCRSRV